MLNMSSKSNVLYFRVTHVNVVRQILPLVDLVGFHAILFSQSEDAVLSWADIGPTQVDIFGLLVLWDAPGNAEAAVSHVPKSLFSDEFAYVQPRLP